MATGCTGRDLAVGAPIGYSALRRADERGAERQHLVAVARRALREEHHDVALREPPGDGVGLCAGRVSPVAVDEDGALCARQESDDRPARDLLLGDEGDWGDRREDRNVEPGIVVGEKQQRTIFRGLSSHRDANAHKEADEALPKLRDPHRRAAADPDREDVERQQHRERERGEKHSAVEANRA